MYNNQARNYSFVSPYKVYEEELGRVMGEVEGLVFNEKKVVTLSAQLTPANCWKIIRELKDQWFAVAVNLQMDSSDRPCFVYNKDRSLTIHVSIRLWKVRPDPELILAAQKSEPLIAEKIAGDRRDELLAGRPDWLRRRKIFLEFEKKRLLRSGWGA